MDMCCLLHDVRCNGDGENFDCLLCRPRAGETSFSLSICIGGYEGACRCGPLKN